MSVTRKKKARILLESGTNEVEFLRIILGDACYGINVAKVRQAIVFEKEKLSPIPGAVKGLIGSYIYRGECVSVIDLRECLDLPEKVETAPKLLLVSEFNLSVVAFLVDRIHDILRCSWDAVRPIEVEMEPSSGASITGSIVQHDEITHILDVETIVGKLVPATNIANELESSSISVHESLHDKVVVYCEDSPTVQKVLMRFLLELGFRHIHGFTTGEEGLDFVSNQSKPVDIVISDTEMPKMDGLTLCKSIRQLPNHTKLPFLFFSSTVTPEMEVKCHEIGGTGAFSKPELEYLGQTIVELFNAGGANDRSNR